MKKKEIQATTINKEGKLTAIASTEDEDRSGDVLSVKNWDFSKFLLNPVLQAGHNYAPQYTIGKAENLRIEGSKVLFDPVFHTITPLAKQVKEMYEQGFLKAWSVGFIPGTAQLKGEENGSKNELLEISAVAVPANAYALMKSFEETGEFEDEINDWLHDEKEVDTEDVEEVEDADETDETDEVDEEENVDTKSAVEIVTASADDHTHVITIDKESGDGTTDEVNGHVHPIKAFEMEEVDGHTHDYEIDGKKYTKKPKKKKEAEKVERWNKQLPNVFDTKGIDMADVEGNDVSFNDDIAAKYLDCKVKEIFVNSYEIPSPLIGQYLAGFKEVMKEYELEDVRNWTSSGREMPPHYEVVKLSSEEADDFLVSGYQYYKVHSDDHAIIKVQPTWFSLGVQIVTNNEKKEWNKNLLQKVHKWVSENNKMKGEKFALSGEFLPKTGKSWDDVVVESAMQKAVQTNLDKVVEKDAKSRGLLFVGPPGTGKTMTGKVMKDTSDSTFIWVSSGDIMKIGPTQSLKLGFKMARDLAPSILFLEDIDTWLRGFTIDLVKTEMDGIRENKGVITVLTSNNPEELPDALIDRPGRFHEILEFANPSAEIRKEMLKRWVGEIEEKTLDSLIEQTEGFSGAYIKELVDYAEVVAEDEELGMGDALVKSLAKLIEQRELVQRIRQTQKSYATIEDKEEVEDVISEYVPEKVETKVKKVKKSRKIDADEVVLRALQIIAKTSNETLHKAKKNRK